MKLDRRFKKTVYFAAEHPVCFVLVTGGLFLKTHICVAFVACPTCGAPKGHPCTHGDRWTAGTHCKRREALQKVSR